MKEPLLILRTKLGTRSRIPLTSPLEGVSSCMCETFTVRINSKDNAFSFVSSRFGWRQIFLNLDDNSGFRPTGFRLNHYLQLGTTLRNQDRQEDKCVTLTRDLSTLARQ